MRCKCVSECCYGYRLEGHNITKMSPHVSSRRKGQITLKRRTSGGGKTDSIGTAPSPSKHPHTRRHTHCKRAHTHTHSSHKDSLLLKAQFQRGKAGRRDKDKKKNETKTGERDVVKQRTRTCDRKEALQRLTVHWHRQEKTSVIYLSPPKRTFLKRHQDSHSVPTGNISLAKKQNTL